MSGSRQQHLRRVLFGVLLASCRAEPQAAPIATEPEPLDAGAPLEDLPEDPGPADLGLPDLAAPDPGCIAPTDIEPPPDYGPCDPDIYVCPPKIQQTCTKCKVDYGPEPPVDYDWSDVSRLVYYAEGKGARFVLRGKDGKTSPLGGQFDRIVRNSIAFGPPDRVYFLGSDKWVLYTPMTLPLSEVVEGPLPSCEPTFPSSPSCMHAAALAVYNDTIYVGHTQEYVLCKDDDFIPPIPATAWQFYTRPLPEACKPGVLGGFTPRGGPAKQPSLAIVPLTDKSAAIMVDSPNKWRGPTLTVFEDGVSPRPFLADGLPHMHILRDARRGLDGVIWVLYVDTTFLVRRGHARAYDSSGVEIDRSPDIPCFVRSIGSAANGDLYVGCNYGYIYWVRTADGQVVALPGTLHLEPRYGELLVIP